MFIDTVVVGVVVKLNQDLEFITKGLKFEAWVNFKNWSSTGFNRSVNPYYFTIRVFQGVRCRCSRS